MRYEFVTVSVYDLFVGLCCALTTLRVPLPFRGIFSSGAPSGALTLQGPSPFRGPYPSGALSLQGPLPFGGPHPSGALTRREPSPFLLAPEWPNSDTNS